MRIDMKNISFFLLLFAIVLSSCNENQMVKNFGGKSEIHLSPNCKLENITWKDTDIWILVSVRPDSVEPKIYHFYSKKDMILRPEGEYIIHEH